MKFINIKEEELENLLDLVLKMNYCEWCKFKHCIEKQFTNSIGKAVINDKKRLQLTIEMEL